MGSRIRGTMASCAQFPAMPLEPARRHSAEVQSHLRPKTSFWQLHSAKGNSPRAANHSPNLPRIQKATQAVFATGTTLSIAQSGAGLPLAPWALLHCWGSPAAQTHSPRVLLRGEAGLGARRSSVPRPQPCPLSQLGRSAPRPHHTERPKRASGSCILQRETLLGQQTTAPTCLGSRKQRKPFSRPAPRSPKREAGLACPWLPEPCCFTGYLRRPKPSPHGFSFVGKQDWAREEVLCPGPSHAP